MSGRIDAEAILGAFLAPEADRLRDRVLDDALDQIARTPQRRGATVPWRLPNMPALTRATAVAALIVVATAGVGAYLGSNAAGGPHITAIPTPIVSPATASVPESPVASREVLDTSTWSVFTSARYGFRAAYPPSFTVYASRLYWTIPDSVPEMFDGFKGDRTAAVRWLTGSSLRIPEGTTQDAWLAAYRDDIVADELPLEPARCFPPRSDWATITIDGHAAELRTGCGTLEATLFIGDRVYVFGAYSTDSVTPPTEPLGVAADFEDLFDAWLTTIKLEPGRATNAPTPSAASTGG